jgi:hypothetical protein
MTLSSETFIIQFGDQQFSPAIRVPLDANPQDIVERFGLLSPRPVIFITGGASAMTEDDIAKTNELIEHGIAAFAAEHNITVIDGGTEAGVMKMMGVARRTHDYKFPLVGIAPYHKVSFPGHVTPETEAELEAGHSHFVLVESHEWGGESQTIVNLTKAIAARQKPMIGVLINGGRIAERDVYLATAQGDNRIPVLVIDGSGRTADTISTAYKTQTADTAFLRAIISGDIRLTALKDGVPALLKQLARHFEKM